MKQTKDLGISNTGLPFELDVFVTSEGSDTVAEKTEGKNDPRILVPALKLNILPYSNSSLQCTQSSSK